MAIIRTSARNIQAGDTIVQGIGLPNLTVTKIEVVGSAIAERRKAKGYANPLKQPPVISRKELRVLRLQLRTSYDCRTLTVREDAIFRIINRIGN